MGVVTLFLTLKKWNLLYGLCLLLLFVGFAAILWRGSAVQASNHLTEAEQGGVVLIIDPGHGGEDGGAVASDGTVESQINLSIALKMEEAAHLLGVDTVMTRREDVSIYDEDAETLRQKKISDLHNRVALCNSIAGGILISIHQNSLPTAKSVQGAQVFYNGAAGSEELALAIQTALNTSLNGDHPKSIKKIDGSVYLMENTTCPAVLVECGFLSNATEVELLKSPIYQDKLAVVILSAALDQLSFQQEPLPAPRTP